ncbi:galanin receptor type 1b [Thalassophryne amazonica]|uniref:galanin receptor type 1b n=1 Tax=Thalassophryne amazonica TaxID=390379 RepID=UPI00147190E4|nr:galanin receptor type 1b [Thalassophryne amazonica]
MAPPVDAPEAVVVPAVFALIFAVGVVGNALVMAVVARRPRAVGSTSIFIVNLSAADLLFLVLCVPLHAAVYALPHWVFGALLCTLAHYFVMACMLVSVFTLVALSVDRYVAVVRANRAPRVRSRRTALAGVCVIWILSLILSVPVAQHQVLTEHPSAPNATFCWERWSGASRRAYRVTVLLLGYVLPLLVISCCYTRVLIHIHKKMKNMTKKSERSKKKTTQTVLLVVTAFLISWMPYHIIAMWVEFGTFPLNDATFAFRIISHCLSYGNSCINPVLYAFMSENFRKACRQAFTCRCPCLAPESKTVQFRLETFTTTHTNVTVQKQNSVIS